MEKGYNVQVGGENYWDLREPAEWTIGTGIKGYALIPTNSIEQNRCAMACLGCVQ